ncbi:MAG: flagellar hook assembly protein FlgD, partial [Solibacillus isronensis]
QKQSQLMNYSTFVGKEVKWHEITDKVDADNKPIYNEGTGAIKELKFVDGEAVFVLADGKEIKPGNISSILGSTGSTEPTVPAGNPLAEASQLIGQTVQYTNGDQVVEAIIEAIKTNNVNIEYILNDGSRLTKDQFTVSSQTTQNENVTE